MRVGPGSVQTRHGAAKEKRRRHHAATLQASHPNDEGYQRDPSERGRRIGAQRDQRSARGVGCLRRLRLWAPLRKGLGPSRSPRAGWRPVLRRRLRMWPAALAQKSTLDVDSGDRKPRINAPSKPSMVATQTETTWAPRRVGSRWRSGRAGQVTMTPSATAGGIARNHVSMAPSVASRSRPLGRFCRAAPRSPP